MTDHVPVACPSCGAEDTMGPLDFDHTCKCGRTYLRLTGIVCYDRLHPQDHGAAFDDPRAERAPSE